MSYSTTNTSRTKNTKPKGKEGEGEGGASSASLTARAARKSCAGIYAPGTYTRPGITATNPFWVNQVFVSTTTENELEGLLLSKPLINSVSARQAECTSTTKNGTIWLHAPVCYIQFLELQSSPDASRYHTPPIKNRKTHAAAASALAAAAAAIVIFLLQWYFYDLTQFRGKTKCLDSPRKIPHLHANSKKIPRRSALI